MLYEDSQIFFYAAIFFYNFRGSAMNLISLVVGPIIVGMLLWLRVRMMKNTNT